MEYTIIRLAETDSTNKQLKELWLAGRAGEGTAVLAERQTAGRGRLGRDFFSPEGGLYFSLLLRPRDLAADAGLITVSASVALARACDRFLPEGAAPTKIKWVNDLYRDGRKIAGILAEAVSRGSESRVILGVGVNLTLPEGGFPAELREKAGALFTALAPEERENLRLSLFEAFLGEFEALCGAPDCLPEYRARMFLTGRPVNYEKDGRTHEATVTGVGERGELLLREDGREITLSCGEVSVRV